MGLDNQLYPKNNIRFNKKKWDRITFFNVTHII